MREEQAQQRHRIDNVAALLDTMRRDEKYAQSLHYLAESKITGQLRRKFFRMPPELVVDAFNEAFLQLLGSKTFSDEAFQRNQPSSGWTAAELVTQVLGGYLYVSARNELSRLAEQARQDDNATPDGEPFSFDDIADDNPASDPARLYEELDFLRNVQACMGKLDADEQDALQMYLDQVPIATIATRLNETSPANMKTRLHRIRKRVLECVQRRLR